MPPRAPFSRLVIGPTIVKSVSAARVIQILQPLITQSSLSRLARVVIAARSEPAPDCRNADERSSLASHVRSAIDLPLALVYHRPEHSQVRAVGRQVVGHDGPADLLMHCQHRHICQRRVAHISGRIQAPQAKRPRHRTATLASIDGERRAFTCSRPPKLFRLQRQQLFAHEASDKFRRHPVFLLEFEVHYVSRES